MLSTQYGSIQINEDPYETWKIAISSHLQTMDQPKQIDEQTLASKVSVIALIFIGQIPLGRISILSSNTSDRWFKAISNITAFSLLNIWSLRKIESTHSKIPLWTKIKAVFGGVISQIPVISMAYIYNGKSTLYGFLAGVANLPIPILSLMMDHSEPLTPIQQRLIDELSANEEAWRLHAEQNDHNNANIALFNRVETINENCCEKAIHITVKALGATLATANIIFNATVGFKFAQEWTDKSLICTAVAALTAYSTARYFQGLVGIASRVYTHVIDRFRGTPKAPLSFQMQPQWFVPLWMLTFTLSSFPYDPSLKACHDNYEGVFRDIMKILVPAGLGLIICNAITDLVNDAVLLGIQRCGTEDQKRLVHRHQQLEHCKKWIASHPTPP